MRLLLAVALLAGLALAGRKPTPAPERKNTPTTREAVERLGEIEREIKSHQAEADEEVRQARERAKQITKEGEEKSRKIREEAEAYTKKIQREIEEIQKRGPEGWADANKGVPTRQEMSDALASLVDRLLACWQPAFPPSARPKPEKVEECVVGQVRERFRGRYSY